MGRPKIVEFTGLEDMESLDSRPAKKKSKKHDTPVIASERNLPAGRQAISTEIAAEDESPRDDKLEAEVLLETNPDIPSTPNLPDNPEAKTEKLTEEVKAPVKPKVGTARVRSKKHTELSALVEKGKNYPVDEALETLRKTKAVSFDPTVEIHMNMGVDVTKTDQQVRTTTKLPHSIGKSPKLLVFADGFKADPSVAKAMEDKDVTIGDEKTIESIERTGKIDAKKIIAHPDWMPRLTKVAKILGPKGLMPNPKTGTVTSDVAKTVADFKGGLLEIRTEVNGPIIHSRIGKLSLEDAKLKENLTAFIDAINKAKPTGVKRNYIKSVYLNTTMGPSVKLDLSSL